MLAIIARKTYCFTERTGKFGGNDSAIYWEFHELPLPQKWRGGAACCTKKLHQYYHTVFTAFKKAMH